MRALLRLGLIVATATPLAAQTDTLPARVAERQIEAFNRRDIDAFMALYAEEATVSEFPSGTVMSRGRAEVRERYEAMFRRMAADAPPVRIDHRVVDGAFVLEDERWDAPLGERNRAIWMYEIRGGLIRKAWTVRMP